MQNNSLSPSISFSLSVCMSVLKSLKACTCFCHQYYRLLPFCFYIIYTYIMYIGILLRIFVSFPFPFPFPFCSHSRIQFYGSLQHSAFGIRHAVSFIKYIQYSVFSIHDDCVLLYNANITEKSGRYLFKWKWREKNVDKQHKTKYAKSKCNWMCQHFILYSKDMSQSLRASEVCVCDRQLHSVGQLSLCHVHCSFFFKSNRIGSNRMKWNGMHAIDAENIFQSVSVLPSSPLPSL